MILISLSSSLVLDEISSVAMDRTSEGSCEVASAKAEEDSESIRADSRLDIWKQTEKTRG